MNQPDVLQPLRENAELFAAIERQRQLRDGLKSFRAIYQTAGADFTLDRDRIRDWAIAMLAASKSTERPSSE